MFVRAIALFAALAVASGNNEIKPGDSLSAASEAGKGLLSKATRILNDERDLTFVANYDIKYKGCSSLVQFREEGGGGDEGFIYNQNLVKFSLCPSDGSCSSCKNGADYVVSMNEFVAAYTEYKLEVQEQACQSVVENCNNDDENTCYYNAGMEECIENEDGEEEFNLEEYLECREMENQNNNNNNNNGNNNNNQYFIGPYCSESDGWSIHLGVFSDEVCYSRASTSVYENANYGQELPYSSDPIVESDCISCLRVDDNNDNQNNQNNQNNNYYNNNYYYNDEEEIEVNEFCDRMYEEAARCETRLEIDYKDTSACEYIEYVLPRLESAVRSRRSSSSSGGSGGRHPAATAFAWIFGITTVTLGAYVYFLYGKLVRRRGVDLSSTAGALA